MKPIYEVVSAQILLSKRREFFDLHSRVLLPVMVDYGIKPQMLLITEIGRFGRFLDIYRYEDLAQYEAITDRMIEDPRLVPYYEKVGPCIHGSIAVEIMRELPYAAEWAR